MDITWIIYVAIGLTALCIGVLVFLLFPGPRAVAPETVGDVDPALGRVQSATFATSILAAAPRGYIGWLEKQVVFAGRPIGWTVSKILTWKVILLVFGAVVGLLFIFAGGPQPLKILLAIGGTTLLFFLPDVLINSRAHDRQQAIKLALPDTLDQMTIAVQAGLGFDAAMAKAARNGKGPLAEELIRVLQDMSI